MGIIYRPAGRAEEYSHLAANLYIGCAHGCKYCYGPVAMKNPDFFTRQNPRSMVIERLKKEAPKYQGTDERVLLCFGCDPYQPLDKKHRRTRQAIEIFKDHDIPFQVLTKAGLAACRDFDLYGPHDMFAVTLTLLDESESRLWEPRAALPAERIESLELAGRMGIVTWVSLEPVIDPEQSLELIRQTHHCVGHYKIGKMNHAKQDLSWSQWRDFGIKAVRLCRELGVDFYIKEDLAKYLDGISFTNTDKRKIKR